MLLYCGKERMCCVVAILAGVGALKQVVGGLIGKKVLRFTLGKVAEKITSQAFRVELERTIINLYNKNEKADLIIGAIDSIYTLISGLFKYAGLKMPEGMDTFIDSIVEKLKNN